jgi:transcriptional regulator with XRE-family HTH domain
MPKYLQLEELAQPAAQMFGQRLKERRLALGLTQSQLFEQTGITAAYISFIERGKANPTLDMMVKLSEAVGSQAWDMIRPDAIDPQGADAIAPKG